MGPEFTCLLICGESLYAISWRTALEECDAVQMVDFVLEASPEEAVSLDQPALAIEVVIADPHV